MLLHDAADEEQSHAGAVNAVGACVAGAVEAVEYLLLFGGRNANALILNGNGMHFFGTRVAYRDAGVRPRVFDGVGDYIVQRPFHGIGIALDRDGFVQAFGNN